MNEILKAASVEKQSVSEGELALINRQSLRPLAAEEVFTFRLAACDNQPDRDHERFTDCTLDELAPMFVGRPVLMDHQWSAGKQTARVYAAGVEPMPMKEGGRRLVLRCYMPRTEQTAPTITAIESGILRECSVGCAVERAICSICGADQTQTCCTHAPGREYDGRRCLMELDGARDAYEVSLLPVPAQPEAGIIKSKRYGGLGEPQEPPAPSGEEEALRLAMAIQEQEKTRYGGNNA